MNFGWIGAVSNSVQSKLDNYLTYRQNDKARRDAKQVNAQQQHNFENQIQTRVADARAAGVHPLVALGAQTISPGFTVAGQSGYDNSGMARAGEQLGAYLSSRAEAKNNLELDSLQKEAIRAQIRASDAQANRDNSLAAQQFAASVVSRAAQASNSEQDVLKTPRGHDLPLGPGSTTQDVEDQYGDVVGAIYGVDRFMHDRFGVSSETLGEKAGRIGYEAERFVNNPKNWYKRKRNERERRQMERYNKRNRKSYYTRG